MYLATIRVQNVAENWRPWRRPAPAPVPATSAIAKVLSRRGAGGGGWWKFQAGVPWGLYHNNFKGVSPKEGAFKCHLVCMFTIGLYGQSAEMEMDGISKWTTDIEMDSDWDMDMRTLYPS